VPKTNNKFKLDITNLLAINSLRDFILYFNHSLIYSSIFFIFNSLLQAETQNSFENKDDFKTTTAFVYEINSEIANLKQNNEYQFDLKLILGYKYHYLKDFFIQTSLGLYHYRQESELFGLNEKIGPLFQIKLNVYKNIIFSEFEYGYFYSKNSLNYINNDSIYQSQNKLGFFANDQFQFNIYAKADFYGEAFYIPEVSKNEILFAARTSLLLSPYAVFKFDEINRFNFNTLIEIDHKNAPDNWGGEKTDLRLGLHIQPWMPLSIKLFNPVVSTNKDLQPEWLIQMNLYIDGLL
jgi:hypothetical protein